MNKSPLLLLALLLGNLVFCPANAQVVQSLSEVQQAIKSSEIQNHYDEQMHGIFKNQFSALSRQDKDVTAFLKLIGHSTDTKKLALLGVRTWKNNQYIITACSYHQAVDWQYEEHTLYANCESDDVAMITLAVAQKDSNGQWQLSAKPYQEKFSQTFDEHKINQSSFAIDSIMDSGKTIGDLDRIDTANYQLNDSTTAFGIRFKTFAGFAGGGISSQAMTLFAIINNQLTPILTVPTYYFEDLAGNWNNDGSRQRHIKQSEHILIVSKQKTKGFYDIIYKEKGKASQIIYRWNEKTLKYQTK